jgi:hypothetical protein
MTIAILWCATLFLDTLTISNNEIVFYLRVDGFSAKIGPSGSIRKVRDDEISYHLNLPT